MTGRRLDGWTLLGQTEPRSLGNGLEVLTTQRCALGEGPHWDQRSETLVFVDILGSTINRYDPETWEHVSLDVGVNVGAAIPRTAGGFAVLERNGLGLIGDDLAYRLAAEVEGDMPGNRMNDAKCDPVGRLYAGTISDEDVPENATLYRYTPEGFESVVSPVTISNGLGWSPTGDRMYYIDTPTRRVDVFDYDLSTGAMANRRPLIEFDESDGYPDGMCLDSEGGLWVAFWEGSAVRRFSASGLLTDEIGLPVRQVSSCCLGGADLCDLFVTTASFDYREGHPDAGEHSGRLFRARVRVPGLPGVAFPE